MRDRHRCEIDREPVDGAGIVSTSAAQGNLQEIVSSIKGDAFVCRGLDEGDGQREDDPADERKEQHLLASLPLVRQASPERRAEKLDERPETDQHTALGSVHAKLFEVNDQQGKEGTKSAEEEEIEKLAEEKVSVDHRAERVQEVSTESGWSLRLLRMRNPFEWLASAIGRSRTWFYVLKRVEFLLGSVVLLVVCLHFIFACSPIRSIFAPAITPNEN
ncbi:hypothetical protein Bpfe_003180 [Biomphalaria pfeifferi]|uniref:Transmembrane protein n=1 Tax=Biomphalaria pfeifferi TaxID=112525 RepID=A0AAD8C8L3_BIOPF|nr:hypothetical protein Bpfe_022373 [Biomphalaria pfeifferi]KAK0048132.1 hypothetical protein Bpfe_022392 [Biomphalaria pfeifferi]KAK0067673.1 hypothetical protein Bpfe_003180 [Biomphalaria pfeifferi]